MTDVIICLGNTFLKSRTIEAMKLRTEKAADLYKQTNPKPKIIFTGGFKTRKDISEAKFMADYAIKLGVLSTDIVLEEKANSTIENAYYCKQIIEKSGFESAMIVTSPYHLMRAKYIFRKIILARKLDFEECKNNLGLFESIIYSFKEFLIFSGLKIKGINLSKI